MRLEDGGAPVLTLREATTDDEPFLFRVYADSRRDELADVPWTDEERLAFLASQFVAQHRYYREQYDAAEYYVVLADAEPCGRLFIAWWPQEIRIMDIALLTARQGVGLGSRLLRALCVEADAAGTALGIHVEKQNPAQRLYARFGFEQRRDRGVYWYFVRPPRSIS